MAQKRILFVDDDVLNQWLLTDCLIAADFAVTGRCRASDALKLLHDGRTFELLLTDLLLPDAMTGFELAEHWRLLRPGRPVLYTSSLPLAAIGTLQPDEGFIRKHAPGPDLLHMVKSLLAEPKPVPLRAPQRRALYIH